MTKYRKQYQDETDTYYREGEHFSPLYVEWLEEFTAGLQKADKERHGIMLDLVLEKKELQVKIIELEDKLNE
jgi:hypothetical protein